MIHNIKGYNHKIILSFFTKDGTITIHKSYRLYRIKNIHPKVYKQFKQAMHISVNRAKLT